MAMNKFCFTDSKMNKPCFYLFIYLFGQMKSLLLFMILIMCLWISVYPILVQNICLSNDMKKEERISQTNIHREYMEGIQTAVGLSQDLA